jgi:hypothetical protein
MMPEAEYDPERALWVPGRRRFMFLGLGALAAAALGQIAPIEWPMAPCFNPGRPLVTLADVSMNYEAGIILDLIPKIYDRSGRIAQEA